MRDFALEATPVLFAGISRIDSDPIEPENEHVFDRSGCCCCCGYEDDLVILDHATKQPLNSTGPWIHSQTCRNPATVNV